MFCPDLPVPPLPANKSYIFFKVECQEAAPKKKQRSRMIPHLSKLIGDN
jgi:hypothetical protein